VFQSRTDFSKLFCGQVAFSILVKFHCHVFRHPSHQISHCLHTNCFPLWGSRSQLVCRRVNSLTSDDLDASSLKSLSTCKKKQNFIRSSVNGWFSSAAVSLLSQCNACSLAGLHWSLMFAAVAPVTSCLDCWAVYLMTVDRHEPGHRRSASVNADLSARHVSQQIFVRLTMWSACCITVNIMPDDFDTIQSILTNHVAQYLLVIRQITSVNWILCMWEQIAVDQGFGGVDSQQKASWLIGVVVDFFRDNGSDFFFLLFHIILQYFI